MVQEAVRVVNVTLSDDAIEPRTVLVPADYPVKFIVCNTGAGQHQLTAEGIPDFSIDVLPGQTRMVTFTFVSVGRFALLSKFDDDSQHGLRGELIIQTLI
ncbi:MAG TPA: cupredoxin domain-containing protein [Chloroflexota bacterium]|nr:cupredoxin domain-containing protein [Chloroflexota bacterium]